MVLVDADPVEAAILGVHQLVDVGVVRLGHHVAIEQRRVDVDPHAVDAAVLKSSGNFGYGIRWNHIIFMRWIVPTGMGEVHDPLRHGSCRARS